MKSALLVIDIQNLLVEEKPYAIEERLALWQDSITKARQAGLQGSCNSGRNDDRLFRQIGCQRLD